MKLTCNKSADTLSKKQNLIHLAILLVIALGIGVYLITTTVVITKDGVWYIQEARKFSSDLQDVIKGFIPFGYMFLIFAAHKLVSSLSGSSSLSTWIYSAQSVTLLCQLLSIIPLYFIGKLLVGGRRSFQAILILIILPYPAECVSEVLREWPHILFLSSGFLFLIWGAKQEKWWLFAAAGFIAGLGHMIRPECAQLLIYGALWIFIRLFLPKPGMSRTKLLCALSVLLIGFAIPAAPYMTARGKFLPEKIKELISPDDTEESKEIRQPQINNDNYLYPVRYAKTLSHGVYTASSIPARIAKAIGELAGVMAENLMYYFVPALLIGIYFHFRKKSAEQEIEMFFVPAFAALNIVMLIALYYSWGYISRRHCLSLVVFTIFYVPTGLEISAGWLANRFSKYSARSTQHAARIRLWFIILLITGITICLPKLLRPTGSDKPGYRTAAAWLRENTDPDDLIASPDSRITFYAERKAHTYKTVPKKKTEYVVTIVKDENYVPDFVSNAQKKYSVWENERRKNKKIEIYKTPL